MNNIQKAAIKLIENDLKFLYSLTIGLNDSSAGLNIIQQYGCI